MVCNHTTVAWMFASVTAVKVVCKSPTYWSSCTPQKLRLDRVVTFVHHMQAHADILDLPDIPIQVEDVHIAGYPISQDMAWNGITIYAARQTISHA